MASWTYKTATTLSDEQYGRWQNLLESRTGISFSQHKSIFQKGLNQRMREIGAEDVERYFQTVSMVPDGVAEWMQLVDRLSVKETSFFRDQHSFRAVRDHLVEQLSALEAATQSTLDLWSVGCSTGEEPYSLAILASDVINFLARDIYLAIYATDISSSALNIARRGRYLRKNISRMPQAFQRKYFSSHGDVEVDIDGDLKSRVCFVQGNIQELQQLPKVVMDVIFCQNVFVYFSRERQHFILDQLVEQLKPGGLLIIGPGEVMGWQHEKVVRSVDAAVQSYVRIT
jgi:chemotaxis protein methyltransferase CheR/type IV pilus assembly protein PilK